MLPWLFLAGIVLLCLIISVIMNSIRSAEKNASDRKAQKKLAVELEQLAAAHQLTITDQLFYPPFGISLTADRNTRKLIVSSEKTAPTILDLDTITYFTVQDELDAFWELAYKALWDKENCPEELREQFKRTYTKTLASITIATPEQVIHLPFYIRNDRDFCKSSLDKISQAMAPFAALLRDLLPYGTERML